MINCWNCYRMHHIGEKLYCPFLTLPKCHRGEHELILPNAAVPLPIEKEKGCEGVIEFSPAKRWGICHPHRKYIFDAVVKNVPWHEMSKKLNIHEQTIKSFVERTLDRYKITYSDLKNWTVV